MARKKKNLLLNYTTSIAVDKTIAEVQTMLAKNNATAVMTEYDGFGIISALSFRIKTERGVMTFRLPANIENVKIVLEREKAVPYNKLKEQAERTAWRIVKDWLEAQCAFIRSEQVKIDQVLLPFAQDNQGVTLYERLIEGKLDQQLYLG